MENDVNKKLYEVGYLLIPLISEEKLADEVNVVRSNIEKAGGFIVLEEQPKMRKLAYEIRQRGIASKKMRFEDAYFGWVRFQGSAESAVALQELLDSNDKILRFIIIKPVKDTPRIMRTGISPKAKSDVEKKDKKGVMSEQEIDKEIDQLLVGEKVPS